MQRFRARNLLLRGSSSVDTTCDGGVVFAITHYAGSQLGLFPAFILVKGKQRRKGRIGIRGFRLFKKEE